MGSFSIWHWLIYVIIALPGFLPIFIKPSGTNRFGVAVQPVNFGQAFSRCMAGYVKFTGRATRSEYWWFYLATFVIGFVVSFVVSFVSAASHVAAPPIGLIVTLLFLLPTLAAGVRRLHDINRSGWWLLLLLTGLGAISLIVLFAWPSQKDDPVRVANVF